MDKLKAIEGILSKVQESEVEEFEKGAKVERARRFAEELLEERDEE